MSRDTSVSVSAVAVAVWLVSYALVLIATRRRVLKPGPPTEDLRPESPAVVSLLTNHFQPASDLAEATVIDLAARKFLEVRPAGVHIGQKYPTSLSPYEQQVFDRVGAAGFDKVSFADLGSVALKEARDAGLLQQRFDQRTFLWLAAGALVAGAVVGGSIFWASGNVSAIVAGLLVVLALFGLLAAGQQLRHTPSGLEAAGYWLGVREFMLSHSDFPRQPLASIDRWERYLAYGSALGVSRAASEALGITAGDRAVRWGSRDRRVRVEYPTGWDRYGRSTVDLLRQAGTRLAFGVALLLFWRVPSSDLATTVVLIVGGYLVLRAVYLLVRVLIDLAAPRHIKGQVLWREPWRPSRFVPKQELYIWRVPKVDYLAIDDGHSDRVTAWALPSSHKVRVGDTVRVTARRWSRRIDRVEG